MPISSETPGPGYQVMPGDPAEEVSTACQLAVDSSLGHKEDMAGYIAMKTSVSGE